MSLFIHVGLLVFLPDFLAHWEGPLLSLEDVILEYQSSHLDPSLLKVLILWDSFKYIQGKVKVCLHLSVVFLQQITGVVEAPL